LHRKERQPALKSGDSILFDEAINFTSGASHDKFTYEKGNIFRTISGYQVRIRQWQGRDHTVIPASSLTSSAHQLLHGELTL
jgi:hypothetical protein